LRLSEIRFEEEDEELKLESEVACTSSSNHGCASSIKAQYKESPIMTEENYSPQSFDCQQHPESEFHH